MKYIASDEFKKHEGKESLFIVALAAFIAIIFEMAGRSGLAALWNNFLDITGVLALIFAASRLFRFFLNKITRGKYD